MKKNYILFIVIISLFVTSCSKEEEFIFVDENGKELAQSKFIQQIGIINTGENQLTMPIQIKGISQNVYRLDVVIFQDGEQLAGGPWELFRESGVFYRNNFPVYEEATPLTGRNIKIDLYRMETATSTRDLIDTLYP